MDATEFSSTFDLFVRSFAGIDVARAAQRGVVSATFYSLGAFGWHFLRRPQGSPYWLRDRTSELLAEKDQLAAVAAAAAGHRDALKSHLDALMANKALGEPPAAPATPAVAPVPGLPDFLLRPPSGPPSTT